MTHFNTTADPHQSETAHFRAHRSRRRVEETPRTAAETKERVYNNFDFIIIVVVIETFSA